MKTAFNEDARFNRIWLRITPQATIRDIFSMSPAAKFLGGDYQDLINGITQGKEPFSWYIPISGEMPTYSFNNKFYKQTPEWGPGGRAMADLMGGFAKSAGNLLGAIPEAVPIISRLKEPLNALGNFFHAFTGSIDSPKIWEQSDFPPIELEGRVAFENFNEYQYYKAAELIFTIMTMPIVVKEIDTVAEIGRLFNVSTDGPIRNYKINLMKRPLTECSFEILVGTQKDDLTEQYSKIELENNYDNLWLFAMVNCHLANFSVTPDAGLDERGIPRLVTFGFNFVPEEISSVLLGFKKLMVNNYYTRVIPTLMLNEEGQMTEVDTLPDSARSVRATLDFNHKDRMLRAQVPNFARALIGNILGANVSAAAGLYLSARAYQTVGPVRVLVGANGKNAFMPSGYPGLLTEIAHNTSTALSSIVK